MLPVVPRIVNSVSCVKRIQHEIHVSWQAQYFVRLEDDTRCVRCCGLRIVFVASNNTSISFPLQCVRRCGLRTAVLHPTAHHHRCLAMHDFFFYRLTCSYRFMFFL